MKMAKAKNTKSNQPKSNDFESVARGLQCNDDKRRFEKKLGKIAKAKPSQSGKK
jgi:hypothetical protein